MFKGLEHRGGSSHRGRRSGRGGGGGGVSCRYEAGQPSKPQKSKQHTESVEKNKQLEAVTVENHSTGDGDPTLNPCGASV